MRSNRIVVDLLFANQVFQVVLSEDDKLVEALLLDALNEPLSERIQVWRGVGKPFHIDTLVFENLIEFLCKLSVVTGLTFLSQEES